MSTVEQLLTPILGDGVRTVNFFNGRMLSGEDMSDEQEAQRRGRKLLGQAVGEGIAFGLEVAETVGLSTRQSPVVTVEAGLAVNRRGQTLKLKGPTSVALTRQAGASSASQQTNSTFKDCQPLQPGTYIVGESVYLLTLAPAEGREGRAPAAGFGGIPAVCGTRYTVEGVQFRLVELETSTQLGDLRSLRNRIAYECFGVEETQVSQRDPFGMPLVKGYGLLDAHRRAGVLTDCEVPLALIHWTINGGIEFIDMWAVRRRLTRHLISGRWGLFASDRQASEAEAMLFQFQEQVLELFDSDKPAEVVAAEHFRYLPPVGVLPVKAGDFNGFNLKKFFDGRIIGNPEYVEAAHVRSLFREAAGHEPLYVPEPGKTRKQIDRANSQEATRGVPVRLYKTWLNTPFLVDGRPVQPSVVYASPYLSHLVAARYEVACFDESTYAGGQAEVEQRFDAPKSPLTPQIGPLLPPQLAPQRDAAGGLLSAPLPGASLTKN
jgi:hypothetical protein